MDGLLESFGLNGGSTNDDQSNEKPAEQAASAPAEEGSQTKETSQTSEPAEQKTETPPPEQKPATLEPQQTDKSAAAFAEMRTRLKEQEDLLKELGKTLGIEGDAKAVVAKLKSIQTEKQAKQAGVPPEIMQRLQALEAEKAERAEQESCGLQSDRTLPENNGPQPSGHDGLLAAVGGRREKPLRERDRLEKRVHRSELRASPERSGAEST